MTAKVVNPILSIKLYIDYDAYENNKFFEVLPSLVSFSEKTTLNGSSVALMQIYDAQQLYERIHKPIIQISVKYNETVVQLLYGVEYSNIETDEMNRSVIRLNLAQVHKVFRKNFSKSFSNNAQQTIDECLSALYESMPLLKPHIFYTNTRIPEACLSGTYSTIFSFIRDNGQSVESSDWCYLWEDGTGVYLYSHEYILAQQPLKASKRNVDNMFIRDNIVFTKAEYIQKADNIMKYNHSNFYSLSLSDKEMYSDYVTDNENRWVMINRNSVYEDNFQNPSKNGLPFQVDKIITLSSYEERMKFEIAQGRLDLKVGVLLQVDGEEYKGLYLVTECIRDISKDNHIQTLECIKIKEHKGE